eukprot:CAMPEP_0194503134 /NCGR_PEP_ID=MMETSP0253-20130528/28213_1 /TAXON_ID=2966 /ORGANISM="Noctiluca scintillans" /LENGTH=124 /DNA_ID=CAMNT_0039345385 /DNA_START=78 /DNA_END=452 /DNA_ORIENTATION=+
MPEIVTFLGCPASIKSFDNLPYKADAEINGKPSYKTTVNTASGEASFTIWYSPEGAQPMAEGGMFLVSSSDTIGSEGCQPFTYAFADEDVADPTQVTFQWVAPGGDGTWTNQEAMLCVQAKISA